MSSVCDICGKTPSVGMAVQRLGVRALKRRVKSRTKRWFRPNVQRVRVIVDGSPKRVNACTTCIRSGRLERPQR